MELIKDKIWAGYFVGQKKLWYDPTVPLKVKGVVRLVELHRSDSLGWSLSIRKIANLLHISSNTAQKAVNQALEAGYLESIGRAERKRGKLRLSVPLRAPVEFEKPIFSKLSQWEEQPISPIDTKTVSPVEAVNNKEITNANSNESPAKSESEKYTSFKISSAYQKLLLRRKELGL